MIICSACSLKDGPVTRSYKISFHKFPPYTDPRRAMWVFNVLQANPGLREQKWNPRRTNSVYLCSLHFNEPDFDHSKLSKRTLKRTAVPTKFTFPKQLMFDLLKEKSAKKEQSFEGNSTIKEISVKKDQTELPQYKKILPKLEVPESPDRTTSFLEILTYDGDTGDYVPAANAYGKLTAEGHEITIETEETYNSIEKFTPECKEETSETHQDQNTYSEGDHEIHEIQIETVSTIYSSDSESQEVILPDSFAESPQPLCELNSPLYDENKYFPRVHEKTYMESKILTLELEVQTLRKELNLSLKREARKDVKIKYLLKKLKRKTNSSFSDDDDYSDSF